MGFGKGNITGLIKDGLRNIKLNAMMSLASVGVLTACLLLVGGAFLVYFNIQSGIKQVGSLGEITLFLNDNMTEDEQSDVQRILNGIPEIYDVQFTSKEQALENLKSDFAEGEELFGMLGEGDNFLPASFTVKVRNSEDYEEMVDRLSQISGIESVAANGDIANALTRIGRGVALFGTVTLVALLVISIFILSNSVKLAMYSRRKEISIMKLVGATNNFVRIPFFVEGVVLGLISAGLSFVIVWFAYVNLTDYLADLSFLFTVVEWTEIASVIAFLFGGIGLFAGAFSSLISIKKYLKV